MLVKKVFPEADGEKTGQISTEKTINKFVELSLKT